MNKILSLCALALLFCATVSAQIPTIQWQKAMGGSSYDYARSVVQTDDGGYMAVGFTNSNNGDVMGNHGSGDFWMVKMDGSGGVQWRKTLGGSQPDEAWCVQQTIDRGYIVCGYTYSTTGDVVGNHGGGDFWVIKLDTAGTVQWKKTYGGTDDDEAYSIQETTDGGYVVAGTTRSNDGDVTGNHGGTDSWVVKIDSTGLLQWQKTLGGSSFEQCMSVTQTFDGGFVATGHSVSNDGDVTGNHGSYDYWVVKLDVNGNLVWEKSMGGSDMDMSFGIKETSDKGYIITGQSVSSDGDVTGSHGGEEFWVVKMDSTGAIQWEKALGGSFNEASYFVEQTADGGYVLAGYAASTDGDVTGGMGGHDFWLVKLDALGHLVWQRTLGGSGSDYAYCVQETLDGGFIMVGFSDSNNGDVTGNHGSSDFWVVKLAAGLVDVSPLPAMALKVSPNPTVGILTIELNDLATFQNAQISVLNMNGQTILKQTIHNQHLMLNIEDQPKGVYILNIKTVDGRVLTEKVEKM